VIVKFMNRGSGRGSGPVGYLLGKDIARSEAKLLSGDPALTEQIIDSLKFASKYTSGVLSFEESAVTPEAKETIMRGFERILFPNMSADEYNILWVEHLDKGRLELNFVIPKVHLPTGKQLNVYTHEVDMPLIKAFRQVTNAAFNYSDPDEPTRKRALSERQTLPSSVSEIRSQLNEQIEELVLEGVVSNRSDIVDLLESAGFSVVRKTNKSISIKNPDSPKNIRLTGALYEQDFRASGELEDRINAAQKRFERSRSERLARAQKELESRVEIRGERLAKRYTSRGESFKKTPSDERLFVSADLRQRGGERARNDENIQSGTSENHSLRQRNLDALHVDQRNKQRILQSKVSNYDSIRTAITASFRAATAAIRTAVQRAIRADERATKDPRPATGESIAERENRTVHRLRELPHHAARAQVQRVAAAQRSDVSYQPG